jgi:hypothetical protein
MRQGPTKDAIEDLIHGRPVDGAILVPDQFQGLWKLTKPPNITILFLPTDQSITIPLLDPELTPEDPGCNVTIEVFPLDQSDPWQYLRVNAYVIKHRPLTDEQRRKLRRRGNRGLGLIDHLIDDIRSWGELKGA